MSLELTWFVMSYSYDVALLTEKLEGTRKAGFPNQKL